MNEQRIKISTGLKQDLQLVLSEITYDKLFLLMDENTEQQCYPLLNTIPAIIESQKIVVKANDTYKNVDALTAIWEVLSSKEASRESLMINLGGGMITDLGGFAASTFKRGIRFINIPTTLLSLVDAAVGGKTGINFNGLKNEVGVFNTAETVLVNTLFLKTLDLPNLLSGFAEMVKHGLIYNHLVWNQLLGFNWAEIDYSLLTELVSDSIQIKEKIVLDDPYEKGIRKALNLGHTIGHAFESFSFQQKRPLLHGYAVAYGLVCELYLSYKLLGFPQEEVTKIVSFVKDNYGTFLFDCTAYETLYELMKHDKKNDSGHIYCTLLTDIGDVAINQKLEKKAIYDSFDFFRELLC